MLVLTRKLMEKLYIGDEICVTVVRLEGNQVRLGIEAPREISVIRGELDSSRGRRHREANGLSTDGPRRNAMPAGASAVAPAAILPAQDSTSRDSWNR